MADIDVSKLSPEDAMFLKKFGRLPPKKKKKGPLGRLGGGERKFFDSADHAMGAAGVAGVPAASSTGGPGPTGSLIATTSNIPKKVSPRPTSMVETTEAVLKSPNKEGEKTEEENEASGDATAPPAADDKKAE